MTRILYSGRGGQGDDRLQKGERLCRRSNIGLLSVSGIMLETSNRDLRDSVAIHSSAFETTSTASVLTNVRAGIETLVDTPILRSLFLVSIPNLAAYGMINSLMLPFALRALHATEFEYGIQEALTSVGFVAGSLLMAGIFSRMREGPWIAIRLIGMALAGMAYSFSTSIGVAYVIVAISGFLNAPLAIGRRLIIQRNTPREMRGRVNSAFFVSRSVLFMLGMARSGWMSWLPP